MEAGGSMDITGRKLFVKALQEEGVDTIFGYPGGMVTDLFDELYKQDGIEVVLPRHEQGLLHEAEGYAKATGKVGVCLVTSGPGATNIITGLADAHYDNIPLVCFTGQVPLNLIGNDAFQEVDIVGMTRSVTKYGVTVRDRKDLGRIIKMAFHIATTGNPGPVLIDIPKDIQVASGPAVYPDKVEIRGYKPSTGVHIGQLKKGYKLLKAAKKPLFLIGGGVNAAKANKELLELVERTKIQRLDGEVKYIGDDGEWTATPDTTPVSMNFWGFTPDYFAYSQEFFKTFLSDPKNMENLKSEFFIPLMVDKLINDGTATVEVLDTTSKWFGVTYPEDRQSVVDKIQALVDAGEYPAKLF